MDRVAIVGVAQSRFEAAKPAETFADLAYDVASRALADAGLTIADVGNIVTASNDFLDGRTISSMAVGDAVGAAFGEGKNISTVEGDGAFAAVYGLSRVLSGSYATTLVVAHSKASEGDYSLLTNASFDPVFERPLGLDWVSAAALQARSCADRHGWTEKDTARAAALARRHGSLNPNARLRESIDEDAVLATPPAAAPIRQGEVAALSDGAAAIVLASESAARRCPEPVWVRGVGMSADGRMTDRPLWRSEALARAAARALEAAGVRAARELDVFELHAAFAYQDLLWRRELGLNGIEESRLTPSGGCLCAFAAVPAGLVRMIEAALQLRGRASNQVPGAKSALAHGCQGLAGQSHCVWVLGS